MMRFRSGTSARSWLAVAAALACSALYGCGGDDAKGAIPIATGPAGAAATAGASGVAPAAAGGGGMLAVAPTPIAGQPATEVPRAGSGPSATAGVPGTVGSAGMAAAGSGSHDSGGGHERDHCVDGYAPHPTDETMKDGPADFYPPGNMNPEIVDTTLQPEVIQWMRDNSWQAAHVEWHAVRACNIPGGGGLSKVNICRFKQLIPADQNCQTAGDGYQFLAFHRHMIQALKQLWPKHTEQFTGFSKFPTSAADVPPQWRSAWKDWEPAVLEAGRIGDEIDKPENLARFPDEGVLGFWLQCNVGQKLRMPANTMPFVGLHFVLHAKWARPGNTTHGVNNTSSNIDNYMFWKLHGWIDNVWEKYRRAKGMMPNDAKLQTDLVAQCREMDTEIRIIKENLDPSDITDTTAPLPAESGFFHETVRPIFASQTNLCSGCHAETGANAMLTLGGMVSSKKIVEGLIDTPSRGGGQYKLVTPGDPDRSWLYLKASGMAAAAGCTPSSTAQCMTGTMPPSASGQPAMNATELQSLRQWIQDGAKGPP